ncbi:hypothetical protein H0H93_002455 [Arthromyces matolae]|nr:hypothetical protein H0H93_002455 [Arthromyces matolae]
MVFAKTSPPSYSPFQRLCISPLCKKMAIPRSPPPTVNLLDRRERMRLVRSNRKLEAVLGVAPCYVEPTSELDMALPKSKSHRRAGRVFDSPTSSFSSTSSSLDDYITAEKTVLSDSKESKRSLELSRPTILRLRSTPVPSTDNRKCLLSPRMPSIAPVSPRLPSIAPVSPLSPRFTIDLENLQANSLETRRRKMAKLTRTLGENIPPELVFPTINTVSEKSKSNERMPIPTPLTHRLSSHNASPEPKPAVSQPEVLPSASEASLAPKPTLRVTQAPSQESPRRNGSVAERRRKPRPRSLSVSTGLDAMLTTTAPPAASPARHSHHVVGPIVQTQVMTHTTIDRLLPSSSDQLLVVADQKATKDIYNSHSPLAFQTIFPKQTTQGTSCTSTSPLSNSSTDLNFPREGPAVETNKPTPVSRRSKSARVPSSFRPLGRRKEVGWSGEWNQDMGKVVKNLRNLKSR